MVATSVVVVDMAADLEVDSELAVDTPEEPVAGLEAALVLEVVADLGEDMGMLEDLDLALEAV